MPSLAKNFFYNALLTLANLVFPLILFVYVSRIIGPEGLGKVSFAASVASYFLLIGLFGVGNYGIREVARSRTDSGALKRTFNELFLINCITIGLALLAYSAFFLLTPKVRAEPQLFFINGLSILLSLFSFDWLFQGLEDYRYITLRSILVKTVSLGLMFVFVRTKSDYVIYAFLTVLGLSANYLFNAYFAHKRVGFSFHGLDLSRHFPTLIRFFLIALATSLYLGMDKLFLGFLSGDYYVGLYMPAEKIARLGLSLVTALATVFYPRMSNVFAQGDEGQARAMIANSLHAVFLLALPVFVGIEVLAGPIITVISGQEFLASITTLRIESLIILPVTLANVAGIQILVGSGREGRYLLSVLGGSAAFLATAVFLVPGLRQDGAALAMVAAETAGAGLQLFWVRDRTRGIGLKWLWPLLASTLVMGACVAGIQALPLTDLAVLILGTALGAGIYFFVLYLFKDSIMAAVAAKLGQAFRRRRAP